MKKSFLLLVSMMLILTLALSACSSSTKTTTSTTQSSKATTASSSTTSSSTTASSAKATNEPQDGGTITYAYTQAFKGVFDPVWYGGQDDYNVIELMTDSLVDTGDDLKPKSGMATWDISADHKTITFHIKHGIKWQDGVELTAQDMKFAYDIIADPAYEKAGGSRFSNVSMIVGAQDYHDGKAKTISGIKVIDTYTIQIKVKDAQPNIMDNLWSTPEPYHYLKDIPIKDMQKSDKIRQHPIGTGAFKVSKVVPGEQVELVRNDNYWRGKPHLDKVVYKIIDPSLATGLLKNGEVDLMIIPSSQYEQIQKLNDLNLIKEPRLGYAYIGFKLGHWYKKKGQNVMDNPKFQSKKLRQAMAYAIDRQGIVKGFSHGLGIILNVPMPSVSWAKIPEDQVNQYPYDPAKAKQLLDEAGYKDVDGDGFREDPNGKKFVVNFTAMSGDSSRLARAQYIIQNWKDVGINAQLEGGKLKSFNTFYNDVENDKKSVETFLGAWGLASDPDPTGLWKTTDIWNFPRWSNKQSDQLINEGISQKAFDQTYRKQVYYQWQKLVNDELPMIFLYQPIDVYAANKRLHNVHANSFTDAVDPQNWWVSK